MEGSLFRKLGVQVYGLFGKNPISISSPDSSIAAS
jgi:hypothetical protein